MVRSRVGPESLGPGEVQVWNRVTGSQFCPVEDHGQQGQVRPRWGPDSPNPGEAQVGTTITRSRVVSGADQNHQVQVGTGGNHTHQVPVRPWWGPESEVHEKLETLQPAGPHDVHGERESPVTGEDQVGIRLTMSR